MKLGASLVRLVFFYIIEEFEGSDEKAGGSFDRNQSACVALYLFVPSRKLSDGLNFSGNIYGYKGFP